MKEIPYREFQRGFCKLKDSSDEIMVVARGGRVIGYWRSIKVLENLEIRRIEAAVKPPIFSHQPKEIVHLGDLYRITDSGLVLVHEDGSTSQVAPRYAENILSLTKPTQE